MIVNSRFIFIHNPKTGGTSITQALGGQTIENKKYLPKRVTIEDGQNLPLFRVARTGRFAFGFVRNPWARMVSMYYWAVEMRFVKTSFKVWLTMMNHHMRSDPVTAPPLQRRSQLWWLHGCDFIGRFESLQDDFAYVLKQIDQEPRLLPHINRCGYGDWRSKYDDTTYEFVKKHFAQDISCFSYEFDARVR